MIPTPAHAEKFLPFGTNADTKKKTGPRMTADNTQLAAISIFRTLSWVDHNADRVPAHAYVALVAYPSHIVHLAHLIFLMGR